MKLEVICRKKNSLWEKKKKVRNHPEKQENKKSHGLYLLSTYYAPGPFPSVREECGKQERIQTMEKDF